jgi:hypothetical protein
MKRISSNPLPGIVMMLMMLALWPFSQACADGTTVGVEAAVRAAQQAGVPAETVDRVLALGYEKQLEPPVVADFLGLLGRVQQDGIPLQPFVSKIEEGVAKRAPLPAIHKVLLRKLDDYQYARGLIARSFIRQGPASEVSPEVLTRLTESLYCGVTRDKLERLADQAPAAPLPMFTRAVEVLAALEQMHFDPQRAEQMVVSGLTRNYFTADRQAFTGIIGAAKRKGISDAQIESVALATIQKNGPLQDIAQPLGLSAQDLAGGPMFGERSPGLGPQRGAQPGSNPGAGAGKGGQGSGAGGGGGAGGSGSGAGGSGGGGGSGSGGGSGGGSGSGSGGSGGGAGGSGGSGGSSGGGGSGSGGGGKGGR